MIENEAKTCVTCGTKTTGRLFGVWVCIRCRCVGEIKDRSR